MKTITIRLPDVEAAMLVEVQKGNKAFKDLQQLLIQQIRQEYQKSSGGSCRSVSYTHLTLPTIYSV